MRIAALRLSCLAALLAAPAAGAVDDEWVTVVGQAVGTDAQAKDEAILDGLRKSVEQVCGGFLASQAKAADYQAIRQRMLAESARYVRQSRILDTAVAGGTTRVRVKATVSGRRFARDFAAMRRAIARESNPRVVLAVVEVVQHTPAGPAFELRDNSTVQNKLEKSFLAKGMKLVDPPTRREVTRRDLRLAIARNHHRQAAAIAARFDADLLVIVRATVRLGRIFRLAGHPVYQYEADLVLKVVRADNARILVSDSHGPITVNSFVPAAGPKRALARLADKSAPRVLAAVLNAWHEPTRTIELTVSGMDFKMWRAFQDEAETTVRGVKAVRLLEITDSSATVAVEHLFTSGHLAQCLAEMTSVRLAVTGITPGGIKLKVVPPGPGPPAKPDGGDRPEPHPGPE